MRQISEEWWIGLDESYKTRVEDGSLVLWRPERTVWINVWNDSAGRTSSERLAGWTVDRHPDATDLFRENDGGLLRFAYFLEEPEDEGGQRLGIYSITVSESSTVQMACYFDLKEDQDWAAAVSRSVSFGRPDPSLDVEEPIGENGHLALVSEKVLGTDRAPVLVAFREPSANEEDSGWRFFHGDEDEAFRADPENIALCPLSSLLGIDPSLRVILNTPPGSAWERSTLADPWSPAGPDQDESADWR